MEMLSSKQKTAIIIAGVIVVGIFIFYMSTKTKNYDYSVVNEATESDTKEEEEEIEKQIEEKPKEIVVHITGAVENEGIVKLEEGSRIIDAIEAAGGTTSDVNLKMVNLAYKISDGQKIYIPRISDLEEGIEISGDTGLYGTLNSEMQIDSNANTKININTANVNQLTSISGIGESTANKIIEYREKNGKFKNIEEIKNVSGIGEAKYESIKNYICV